MRGQFAGVGKSRICKDRSQIIRIFEIGYACQPDRGISQSENRPAVEFCDVVAYVSYNFEHFLRSPRVSKGVTHNVADFALAYAQASALLGEHLQRTA